MKVGKINSDAISFRFFFFLFFFVVPNASLLLCHTQIRMDCVRSVRAFVCVSPFHVYLQLQALHIVFIIKIHLHSIGTS